MTSSLKQSSPSFSSSIQQKKEIVHYIRNKIEDSIEQKKDFSIGDLIKSGESSALEFKSSMLAIMEEDLEIKKLQDMTKTTSGNKKKSIESRIIVIERIIKDALLFSIIKTISSFLNSKGGILLIGVQDNGVICGIENDYSFLEENPNWNGWSRHLFNIVEKQIGIEHIKYLQIKKIYYLSKTIAKIIVNKSSTPIYIQKKGPKFYVRRSNTCRLLDTVEANNYILKHWIVFDNKENYL